jgi:hypothetical protein
MLYWGEGAKSTICGVDFANSDEKMIKIFLNCLRNIYQVSNRITALKGGAFTPTHALVWF